MAQADDFVLPNPAVPKTFGILNVLFAVVLGVVGIGGTAILIAMPTIQSWIEVLTAQQRAAEVREQAAELQALDKRSATATTDDARAIIARERAAMINRPAAPSVAVAIDLSSIPTDPASIRSALLIAGWNLILNGLLLASGIGLVKLREWGRRACFAWVGLTIATVLALTAYNAWTSNDSARAAAEAQLVKLRVTAQQPNATPGDQIAVQIAETVTRYRVAITLSAIIATITYPILCLIFLNSPRARTACRPLVAIGVSNAADSDSASLRSLS